MAGSIREAGETRVTEGITPEGTRALNESARIQDESASRNAPQRIIDSIPKLHAGGTVPADGAYNLQAGEQVTAAPQTQQDTPDDSNLSDDESTSGAPVSLQKAYSHLNAAVRNLFDGLGIIRSATIPHQNGQTMDQHLADIGRVMSSHGQITGNIMTATHSIHDKDGGSTVGHGNQKLMETKIPKDSELAKAAIAACRSLISKCEQLIGETPEIQRAKSQISIVGKSEGVGVTAFDLGVALLNIPNPVIQALARKHSEVKHGRIHPALTGPKAQGK
jgi:hypothetical protein